MTGLTVIWLLSTLALIVWTYYAFILNRENHRVSPRKERRQWIDLWDEHVQHLPMDDRIRVRNQINIMVYTHEHWPKTYSGSQLSARQGDSMPNVSYPTSRTTGP